MLQRQKRLWTSFAVLRPISRAGGKPKEGVASCLGGAKKSRELAPVAAELKEDGLGGSMRAYVFFEA